MNNKILLSFLILLIFFVVFICCESNNNAKVETEDYKTGNINISIDESFKPVFEEMERVFLSSYPDAHLNISYKSEAKCIEDWYNDSVRLVICTKKMSDKESEVIGNNLEFKPRESVVAYDAIAVVLNKFNKDSLLDVQQVKDILMGQNKTYTPIIEGLDQSSVLRYINENILKKEKYTSRLKGSENATELIKSIARNKNFVGFIGINWVGNSEDSLQISFNKQVNIAALECKKCDKKGLYVKPYQANMLNNRYPFIREIRYVLKENYVGLGRGFVNFLSNERGQLLFKRNYLIPAKMNFNVRNLKITPYIYQL